jgi:hypothetical protein
MGTLRVAILCPGLCTHSNPLSFSGDNCSLVPEGAELARLQAEFRDFSRPVVSTDARAQTHSAEQFGENKAEKKKKITLLFFSFFGVFIMLNYCIFYLNLVHGYYKVSESM